MPEEEEKKALNKRYYSIGEVADMLNVNPSLIRFWEKEFDLIKPKKNRKGNRLFTTSDIENLKFIYFLVKEKAHTLEGARNVLNNRKNEANQEFQLAETLKHLRTFLTDLKNQLDQS